MPDTKITALAAITTVDPAADVLPIVDISDTSMAASGTTKKITSNQILGAGGTATLASATISGDLTVDTSTLKVDSANNRVGVLNASPGVAFHIGTTGGTNRFAINTAFTSGGDIQLRRGAFIGFSNAADSGNSEYLFANAGALDFGINGSTAMTLNSTGLGVGVTPYASWPATSKALQLGASSAIEGRTNDGSRSAVYTNAVWNGTNLIYQNTAAASYYLQSSGIHSWHNAASGTAGNAITFTQAMTLAAGGDLLVGTTTSASSRIISSFLSSSGNLGIKLIDSQSNNTAIFANFSNGTGTLGTITNNNNAGVLYNTISDYRLKESVTPLSGGLARVNALKPSIYKWKSSGSSGEGFLAHELAEVVPFAVSGEKDAVNADGSIKSQGIDMSRVVPILVAAIQELAAEVNALKNA